MLIFDEIQTGFGRIGHMFAIDRFGVVPDILTTAKALANGLPIGAMLTSEKIAAAFTPGSHASTFGGNPVAAAAAVATLRVLLADGFLAEVVAKGSYFAEQLNALAGRHPRYATGARGSGLLQALILTEAGISRGQEMVNRMFEQGVLINFAGNAVLRFVPPLVVSRAEIDACITALDRMLGGLSD